MLCSQPRACVPPRPPTPAACPPTFFPQELVCQEEDPELSTAGEARDVLGVLRVLEALNR